MELEYALRVLCGAHLEFGERREILGLRESAEHEMAADDRYAEAWATVWQLAESRRRMAEEIHMPVWRMIEALNPELVARFEKLAGEDHMLSTLRSHIFHGAKTPKDTIEILVGALMEQGMMLRHCQKLLSDAASLKPIAPFIMAPDKLPLG